METWIDHCDQRPPEAHIGSEYKIKIYLSNCKPILEVCDNFKGILQNLLHLNFRFVCSVSNSSCSLLTKAKVWLPKLKMKSLNEFKTFAPYSTVSRIPKGRYVMMSCGFPTSNWQIICHLTLIFFWGGGCLKDQQSNEFLACQLFV